MASLLFIPLYTNVFYGLQEDSCLGTKLTCLHMGVTCTHTHTHTHTQLYLCTQQLSKQKLHPRNQLFQHASRDIFTAYTMTMKQRNSKDFQRQEYNQFQHTPPEY